MGMELQRRKMIELEIGIFEKHRKCNIKGVKASRVGTSKGSSHWELEQRDRTHQNTSSSQIKSKFFSYTHLLFSLK
jgi:hypothetical protein